MKEFEPRTFLLWVIGADRCTTWLSAYAIWAPRLGAALRLPRIKDYWRFLLLLISEISDSRISASQSDAKVTESVKYDIKSFLTNRQRV